MIISSKSMAAAIVVMVMSMTSAFAESTTSSEAPMAYYIAEFDVTDPIGLKPYAEQAEATFKPFGGRYIARRGQVESLEGEPPRSRVIIIAFDNMERARAWYHSPEYSKIRPIRQRSGQTKAYIVEGLPN